MRIVIPFFKKDKISIKRLMIFEEAVHEAFKKFIESEQQNPS